MASVRQKPYPALRLDQVGVAILDCHHLTPKPAPAGYPYVAIPNLKDGRIVLDDIRLISEEDFAVWTRKTRPQAGDVIVTRRGRVGDTAVVPPDLACALGQDLVILRSDGRLVDQRFLRWATRASLWQLQVERYLNVGAVFDSLNVSDLPKFEIPVPPITAQLRMADVLDALDDKIELNRWMNQTLEATARAIFKSWFVDFDPVRARMNGRHPLDLDAQATDLFPDSFEDSTLGPIPRGWRVQLIGDVVTVVGGSTPSTNEPSYWGGDTCFMTPRDMASLDSPILLDSERRITQAGLERISSGLLPTGTVLLSSRAPIGYLAIAEVPVAVNQGIIAMVCDLLLPNDYVLHWTRENLDVIIANANGSTFLEISKRNFRPIPVVVPPATLLTHFVGKVRPLHSRMTTTCRSRDSLPKSVTQSCRSS